LIPARAERSGITVTKTGEWISPAEEFLRHRHDSDFAPLPAGADMAPDVG
jgi:hypothetical protein